MSQPTNQSKRKISENQMLKVFMQLEPRERLLLRLRLIEQMSLSKIGQQYWRKLGLQGRVRHSAILQMQQDTLAKIEKFWPKNNLLFLINQKKGNSHNIWQNNWTVEKIEQLLLMPMRPVSLNQPVRLRASDGSMRDNTIELQDIMPSDRPGPHHYLEESFMKGMLERVLGELPLHYREVLKLRFFENATLGDIANRFWPQIGLERPVSQERIRQIEAQALIMAKKKFRQKKIFSVNDLAPAS